MTTDDRAPWLHAHAYDAGNPAAERSTRLVMWITLVMMVIEIVCGWWFNSMALFADGWHMSSHAIAIGLSAFAYAAARRLAADQRFAFGTFKIEILGGFASAILMFSVVALMVVGSIERLVSPQPIHFAEAITVGVIGLIVNLVCALILGQAHDHGHHHGHDHHGHDHSAHDEHVHGHDLNLRAAYVHVIADAATSVLAILALAGGWAFGWNWLDPVTGIVGAVLVGLWAIKLVRQTGTVLLDREMDHPVVEEIREVIRNLDGDPSTELVDLHVWRVGRATYACVLAVVTDDATLTPQRVREGLSIHEEIVHTTIEIHRRDQASVTQSKPSS